MFLIRHVRLCMFAYVILTSFAQDLRIVLKNAKCTYKPSRAIESYECRTVQRKGRSYGYGHIRFNTPIKEMSARVILTGNISGVPNFKLFDVTFDCCKFFQAAYATHLHIYLYNQIKRFVNEFPNCPMKANFTYSMDGAYLEDNFFPKQLPSGTLRGDGFLQMTGESYAHFGIEMQLIRQKQKRKKKG